VILQATGIAGVVLVSPEPRRDERGSFARTYSARAFAAHGISTPLPVTARAVNRRAMTLRGLHFQVPPHGESKLVSCAHGRIFDVVVDLRPGSPTFRTWNAVELDAARADALYVPPGLAHGYLTLVDDTVVLYQMTDTHDPAAEDGIRWDDPSLGIAWPLPPAIVSARDRSLPLLARPR
jgi:dTDP-4-dehydrorhamnose 3,5-epimerase